MPAIEHHPISGSIFNNLVYRYLQPVLLVTAILLLLASGLVTFLNSKKLIENTLWVNHTHEVINTLEIIDSDANHAVASLRGYMLTGDLAFEADINIQLVEMMSAYRDVLQLTQDDSAEQIKLKRLQTLLDERVRLTKYQLTLSREQGFEAAKATASKISDESLVVQIRGLVRELQDKETKLLAQRQHTLDDSNARLYKALSFVAVGGLALIILLLYGLKQQLTERDKNTLLLSNFKAIVDYSDDAIFSETLDGTVLSWNSGAEKLFGYMDKEIIDHSMQRLIHADYINEETEVLANIAQDERVDNFETVYQHKDGHLINVSVTVSPIYDAAGKVAAASKIARDISERKLADAEILKLALYDTLTQLPNRRLFHERFKLAVAASKRSQKFGALLLLDLDNFKTLNDKQGHAAGDLLLCEATRRMKNSLREVDTVARFGGDEFLILLSDLHENKAEATLRAEKVAEKVRTALFKPYLLSVIQADGQTITVEHKSTGSIGVALFIGNEVTVEDLLRNADIAMYQAKNNGGDQISSYIEKVRARV
jgi:diguanylate cyclase (GGDEF)-like protein/PAS domain S-box-containing protein